MNPTHAVPMAEQDDGDRLREAFARGNLALGRIAPILCHLLATPDHSLFSDEIVARVRGMLNDLAWQILRAQAEATGQAGREEFADRHGEALAAHFQSSPTLLAHCHSLALEWQLAARMESVHGLDPVLSPLIQELVASPDSATASTAMAALAAQARFSQAQRRMELPLTELPGDLFHEVLLGWRTFTGETRSDALVRAEAKLRHGFDESAGRIALFARLIATMGAGANAALALDRAGVAMFLAALAARSGQSREMAVLSCNQNQTHRLALGLRAAGQDAAAICETVLALHPGATLPSGLKTLTERDARSMLAASDAPEAE